MKVLYLSVLLIAISTSVCAQTQPKQTHDGYWWINSTEMFRTGFVTGYLMAMNTVGDTIFYMCLAEKNGGKVPEKYPGDEAFNQCKDKDHSFDYSGRVGQWSDGVDEFYKDFRNRGLEIGFAMRYVKEQLKGTPAKELEEFAEQARRNAANAK